jgi:serine/threonine protein kinase
MHTRKRSEHKRKRKIKTKHKRSKSKHKIKPKHKTQRRHLTGGKAIDAGSFGCAFRPSLKCAADTAKHNPNTKYISKLMQKTHGEKEMAEINKVKNVIENIPDNDKYFLVANAYMCQPAELQAEDFKDFDKTCELFTSEGINADNINANLEKLTLLNIPDGGMTLDSYFKQILVRTNKDMNKQFIKVNSAMIQLLVNGIVPINKNKLNHFDVKGNNILIGQEDGQARLIDWGIASENNGTTLPREITDSFIHFNNPFSYIFFNAAVKDWLPTEYARIKASAYFPHKDAGQAEILKVVAVNLLNKIMEKDQGHYQVIVKEVLHNIYKIFAVDNGRNTIDYNVLAQNTVIEYIQMVLLKYVDDNGKFSDIQYFYKVFTKNVDIWGFLMCYESILIYGIDYTNAATNASSIYIMDKEIINSICRILIKYCFSPEYAVKPIPVAELATELEALNHIAAAIDKRAL